MNNVDCSNFYCHSGNMCSYCKENYSVSSDLYKAKRPINGHYVYGYLVKDKNGNVEGILNKDNFFAELAYIDSSTLEKCD